MGANATLLAVKYWITPGAKMLAAAHRALVTCLASPSGFGLGLLVCGLNG